jgi:hypothetical protein
MTRTTQKAARAAERVEAKNREAAHADIADRIRIAADRAHRSGLDTLLAFRDIGKALHEAKEAIGSIPRGAFGQWAEENGCGFSKEWRARLMLLASEWQEFETAMRWAEARGRKLGRTEFSVDGAIALLREWRQATEVRATN